MTGSLYLDLVISLGGVGLLVLVSFLLGGYVNAEVTEAAAAERARFDEPDFRAESWIVDADARAALGVGRDGEIVLAFRKGDMLATRRAAPGGYEVGREGGAVRVRIDGGGQWRIRPADPRAAEMSLGRLLAED